MNRTRRWIQPTLLVVGALLIAGCATGALDKARSDFYSSRFQDAEAALKDTPTSGKDRVLVLMERGMIRQAAGDYERSARDFIQAYDELEAMTALQVGQDTTSLVINDNVQDFRGAPYERTMLHVFAAQSHLALGNWENAAVEARRIIQSLSPEAKGDYPDDAYSRYMAGFALEMIDDFANAALQYKKAAAISSHALIDDRTGRVGPRPSSTNEPAAIETQPWPHELVVFVTIGRGQRGNQAAWKDTWSGSGGYAEIVHNGQVLGRSYTLTDTIDLAFTTEQKEAAKKLVKTASRIAIKETIAHQVEQSDEALGELVRFILIGLLEQPDMRRWETLPRWLQVARVPCPPDLQSFDVVYKTPAGQTIRTVHVNKPITQRRNTRVALARDIVSPAVVDLLKATTPNAAEKR